MKKTAAIVAVLIALAAWWATTRRQAPGVARLVQLTPPDSAFSARSRKPSRAEPSQSRAAETAAPSEAPAHPGAYSQVPPSQSAGRPIKASPAPDAAAQLHTLEEILASKNDNDPRLDSDLKTLTPQARILFRGKYRQLPTERRNERGTIVFLLSRNPTSPEDWAFLRQVVGESPCLSLDDCSREEKSHDPHRELGVDVTLAYPQMVALNQAEQLLEKSGKTSATGQEALRVIQSARTSQSPLVARKAAELSGRF